ncbi:hypothetical protein [Botryobacter ruber]|uniref:hypothetical protein n=1 Tax=Botryobacter ruber TaxID=2171629 RepID=UPI000E0C54EE|nr:hypothetical protein [Botryobacter ruber]
MKKNIKLAFAAFALLAFTACGNDSDTATDTTETVETEVDTDMDMETDLDADTTIVVEDTTVTDGVADEIKEEQPPR